MATSLIYGIRPSLKMELKSPTFSWGEAIFDVSWNLKSFAWERTGMLIVQIKGIQQKRLWSSSQEIFPKKGKLGWQLNCRSSRRKFRLTMCILPLQEPMAMIEMKECRLGRLPISYQMLKKIVLSLLFVTFGICRALLHLIYRRASIKTCLIGCYPKLRITSELGRKSAAMEKEQRKGRK